MAWEVFGVVTAGIFAALGFYGRKHQRWTEAQSLPSVISGTAGDRDVPGRSV